MFPVGGTDLRIVAYTAPSGSGAAAKLDFLRVSARRCVHSRALTTACRATGTVAGERRVPVTRSRCGR